MTGCSCEIRSKMPVQSICANKPRFQPKLVPKSGSVYEYLT